MHAAWLDLICPHLSSFQTPNNFIFWGCLSLAAMIIPLLLLLPISQLSNINFFFIHNWEKENKKSISRLLEYSSPRAFIGQIYLTDISTVHPFKKLFVFKQTLCTFSIHPLKQCYWLERKGQNKLCTCNKLVMFLHFGSSAILGN